MSLRQVAKLLPATYHLGLPHFEQYSLGTTSDVNGNYTLSLPEGTGTLIFSFISLLPCQAIVNNQTIIS